MTTETIISIIASILTIAASLIGYYFKVKANVIDKANQLIDKAEDMYADGDMKMMVVVDELYKLVPTAYRVIFTKEKITKIVQAIFDCVEEYAKKQK